MNEEIEIKVILKNPDQVEKRLKEIGKLIKEEEQKDEYFVPKDNDFFAEHPTREYLRIRYKGDTSKLCYHYCHYDDKGELLKTDEYETEIKDPEMMATILKNLNFVKRVTVVKHRTYYEYKGFEVLIDKVDGLGCFLEVEAKENSFPSNITVEEVRNSCYEILKEIGAEWEHVPRGGYPDLLIRKQQFS